ncbi:hypothetical protein J5N97_025584 [Dioscorea zingiberensis]|uniref:Uncharacterized protein n=1 Tax=Dioscorea zingiberensis TaxID=325984 RepID=A0A9D5C9Q6_9LILI|nr:hypothetical protein J5N97_025584 [Dioscorea zingiberensis]
MSGKGRRRREKNYLAAHGGYNRLPPPPNPKELEAIPSKLRKLMRFKNPPPSTSGSSPGDAPPGKRKALAAVEAKGKKKGSNTMDIEEQMSSRQMHDKAATRDAILNDKSNRKRKRKTVSDLRFLDEAATLSKKKDRKKEYLQARKKKQKKTKINDIVNFPGHEEIKFGDVVEAPPKLSFPKVPKASMDASHERFRLEAIEAYRNQRKWVSRPGIKLPSLAEGPSL